MTAEHALSFAAGAIAGFLLLGAVSVLIGAAKVRRTKKGIDDGGGVL